MQNDVASSAANDDHTVISKSRDYLDFTSVFRPKASLSCTPYMDSRYVMQHQDLINRNALCLTRLREAATEVESLRLENAALRSFNRELNNHLNLVFQTSSSLQEHYHPLSSTTAPFQILNNGFNHFCNIGYGNAGEEEEEEEVCEEEDESPTSVMQVQNVDTTTPSERITLPKSISVRSDGYLKTSQPTASKTRGTTRSKPQSQLDGAHKVYVRGGQKEEEPLEVEVYNQGMFKTELCNKWQETGTCPYGDNCQFAHGIEELRPVIRHPRYKTEVCRMVLAGDACPYGHRCHFRHVLTDHERYIAQSKLQR
ncbi:zinc finger CCCH domain-containing protein 15 [Ricinus communis]|uniref:Zinc finger protein, putative n=1 Tax=Ricinus communis TaxID=3988 RepID=B9SJY0_RICCO|nr:zinc finger CCCH domain-containing protein 15 [Ricinus communis]EEF36088.1 zinc finger protein, putative [Ricinus communis]|eukprot:XP_002526299.1 zinc finger CCCH domain-containing protein 15 [Ricinus communis]